jgi:hypothetical protein
MLELQKLNFIGIKMPDVMNIDPCSFDQRHGGPFDRGSADSWYNRPKRPHYFVGDTYSSPEILLTPGSVEYDAYMAGYDYNEQFGNKKDWS